MDGYLAVLHLDGAVALKLAHNLGDGLAGRGYHVRQLLMRKAHVQRSACSVLFPETLAEFQEQGRQARGDLPVQEALYDLVRLSQAFGEGGEKLHGELRAPLYNLG